MSAQAVVVDSIRSGARMGADMLRAVTASRLASDVGSRVELRGCTCEIPPPCWVPKSLGEVRSVVCFGGRAVLRLRVTNCGLSSRTLTIEAAGAAKGNVDVKPASLTLGPQERGVATATIELPIDAPRGEEQEALLWLRGCHDHYVRWTVQAGGRSDACHELDVDDCPDLVHHWYDHFYCERPCPGGER